jgi:hypothetical protein
MCGRLRIHPQTYLPVTAGVAYGTEGNYAIPKVTPATTIQRLDDEVVSARINCGKIVTRNVRSNTIAPQ